LRHEVPGRRSYDRALTEVPSALQRRRRERRQAQGLEDHHETELSLNPGSHGMDAEAAIDLARATGLDERCQRIAAGRTRR